MNCLKIRTEQFGTICINLQNYVPEIASIDSPIFKLIELMFFDWYEHQNNNIRECYEGFGGELSATHSKKDAVREGIKNLIKYVKNNNTYHITTKDLHKADIEAAFNI